jgi:hypothetical protein
MFFYRGREEDATTSYSKEDVRYILLMKDIACKKFFKNEMMVSKKFIRNTL